MPRDNLSRAENPDAAARPRAAWRWGGSAFVLAGLCLATVTVTGPPATGATSEEKAPVSVDLTEVPASAGEEVLALPWGTGTAEAGRSEPAEGLPRGPEDFLVRPDGRVAVLDSVNDRLLLLPRTGLGDAASGSLALPLDLREPRFLAEGGGLVFVLDSDADHGIVAYDWQGRLVERRELPAFPEPVTGFFARGRRLFVELRHEDVYEIPADTEESPADFDTWSRVAQRSPGRPGEGPGERYVRARFAAGKPTTVEWNDAGDAAASGEVRLAVHPAMEHLVSLDAPRPEEVLLGGRLPSETGSAPGDPDADSAEQASADAEATDRLAIISLRTMGNPQPLALVLRAGRNCYLGEPYQVGPDGDVYQAVADEDAYRILRHALSPRSAAVGGEA